MGCGSSVEERNFDVPTAAPPVGSLNPKYISPSYFYCIVQHVAEWPQYYVLVDTRSSGDFKKSHIVGAEHVSEVTPEKCNEVTVVVYGPSSKSPAITKFLETISEATPTAVLICEAGFSVLKKRYKVVLSDFYPTEGELPGPLEMIPATKTNPALYTIHRSQFQHCKTIIAYLGCTSVINISSRRLFLKTAAIRLENVQFDNVNEPYEEAISILMKYANEKPKSRKGNVLIIDENGCDYAALLIGWYWYKNGNDIERVCEHLVAKMGELDPWYLDVIRAWGENE